MKARENCKNLALAPEQILAARALLRWSRDDLARHSGVSPRTLASIEAGESNAKPATIAAVRDALERAGAAFIRINGGGPGVRLKRS